MSAQPDRTDRTNSEPAVDHPVKEPAPIAGLHKLVLTIFTIAMIITLVCGVLVVAGQLVGIALGSGAIVTLFAGYPSKVAFFAAAVVCLMSLLNHYFPGEAAHEEDD
jgi:hypothetical protein